MVSCSARPSADRHFVYRYKVDFAELTSVDDGDEDEFYDSDDSGRCRTVCEKLDHD